jgi:hypothetical protein
VALLAVLGASTAALAEDAAIPKEPAAQLPHDCRFRLDDSYWISLIGKAKKARLLLDSIVDGEGRIRKAAIIKQEASGELARKAVYYLESGRCELPPGWGAHSAAERHMKFSFSYAVDADEVLPGYPEANQELVSRMKIAAGPLSVFSIYRPLDKVLRDKMVPGFELEPLQAEPAPGKEMKEGDEVRLHLVVRYAAPEGFDGTLKFRLVDGRGSTRPFGDKVVEQAVAGPSGAMALDTSAVIPKGVGELTIVVQLLPKRESAPSGLLRVTYPVARH